MTDIDQFARNQVTHARAMPQSFVRPVSLDKVREHSSSKMICNSDIKQQHTSAQQTERSKVLTVQSQQHDDIYQRMLQRKLIPDGDSRRKPHFVKLEDRSKQLHEEHVLRERKRQDLARKYHTFQRRLEDEKLRQCTFQPEIIASSERRNKRTLEEFLNSQKEHCRKAADRINTVRIVGRQMKTELDKEKVKEATFQPRINKFVQNIASSSSTCSVHERLYEKSKQKPPTSEKENIDHRDATHQEALLRAQIRKPSAPQAQSMTRIALMHNPSSQSISMKQVADRKRQQSSNKKQQQQQHQGVGTSLNSQRMLIHKVMKEMCHHCHSLGIRSDRISYLQLGDLMSLMNFVKEDTGGLNERRHLFEIWELLGGEAHQFITLHNLLKVVCSIVGLHNMKLVEKQAEESGHEIFKRNDFQLYSQPVKGRPGYQPVLPLQLDEKESRHIRKIFEALNITRLNHEDHSKRIASEESSFKPEISELSKELAERHRIRILQETSQLIKNRQIDFNIPENGEISHPDLLLIQKKAYEAKAREKKQLKDEMELEASTMRNEKPIHEHSTRYLDLYDLSKAKGTRRDRTADEIELERYRHELTFKPNTSREKLGHWQPVVKDVDKAIYRMYEGRRMKDEKFGCPRANEKVEAVQRTPLLYLNVNIDNAHSERLSVYENDDPTVLAEQFGSRFKLGHEAKVRLCQLIRTEIRDLLCKIPR